MTRFLLFQNVFLCKDVLLIEKELFWLFTIDYLFSVVLIVRIRFNFTLYILLFCVLFLFLMIFYAYYVFL